MTGDRTETKEARGQDKRTGHGVGESAVTELLDHIAVELAREYVRLMEQAAEDERAANQANGYKEGSR